MCVENLHKKNVEKGDVYYPEPTLLGYTEITWCFYGVNGLVASTILDS